MKTWTLSERLVTKKSYGPKALRENLPLIRTYLLCALSRHSPQGSEGVEDPIELMAANTFRSPKRPTLLKRSTLQNQSAFPLVAHLTIHWSGTIAFDDPECTRFAKVRKGLDKILFRRGIPGAWVVQSSHRHRALPSTFSTPATVPFECKARSDQGCTGSLSWSPR